MNDAIQILAPRISDCLKVTYEMLERGHYVSTSAVREWLGTSKAPGQCLPDLLTHLRSPAGECMWMVRTLMILPVFILTPGKTFLVLSHSLSQEDLVDEGNFTFSA